MFDFYEIQKWMMESIMKGKTGTKKRPVKLPDVFLRWNGSERDRFAGAGADAGAALDAFRFDDVSFVAIQFDRADRAGINARAATDAGVFINFCSHFLISFLG